ncbi:peptide alpha-n-acetyltransferase [Colletotrichum asianum]|uniref:Peptide alpha-n-acetyltransferase n=1 Tax=Colletotrichum asianum TaxID=702518 RepID=A0A8H3WJ94_9PEZI|nr:peptide alpha-n-acetyltransferase [Colletotrichum asianum]
MEEAVYVAQTPAHGNALARWRNEDGRITVHDSSRPNKQLELDCSSFADRVPSLAPDISLKKLSKEYGWSAVGVYLALSVLDFPFCFLLVRVVGTDRIGQLEHWVTSHIKQIIPESVKTWWHEYRAALTKAETAQLGSNDVSEAVEMAGWGVEEAQERNRAEASKFMHLVSLML